MQRYCMSRWTASGLTWERGELLRGERNQRPYVRVLSGSTKARQSVRRRRASPCVPSLATTPEDARRDRAGPPPARPSRGHGYFGAGRIGGGIAAATCSL